MPPPSASLLSPPHLSYLHSSLSLTPPIRPDARAPTSFRPLRAETDLLPAANGSARICFADGTEAVVGVRAEVERTVVNGGGGVAGDGWKEDGDREMSGDDSWVEVAVEMAGQSQQRSGGGDEEGEVVFLEQMLREGLLADGTLTARLALGRRWHWRLYVDVRIDCMCGGGGDSIGGGVYIWARGRFPSMWEKKHNRFDMLSLYKPHPPILHLSPPKKAPSLIPPSTDRPQTRSSSSPHHTPILSRFCP